MEDLQEWTVLVGRVRGRWDVSQLRAQTFTENHQYFQPGGKLCAEKDGKRQLLTVAASRPKDNGWIIDCTLRHSLEADGLIGAQLYVHPSMRPALAEGEFYIDELLGFEVVTEAGESLGEVEEVLETPANLVFATPLALVPDHPDFVVSVDAAVKRITVRDVPGLRTDAS